MEKFSDRGDIMSDLERAKQKLSEGEYTCVIRLGDDVFFSKCRGVAPLVELCKERGFNSFCGASAADKVVGKATAFLYLLLGVSSVYASVISRSALELLSENQVTAEYDLLAEYIINRKKDGICPFENAVIDISDKNKAFEAILSKMQEMKT